MSISNYGELKVAISNWMRRTNLDGRIPEFVLEAETIIAGDPEPIDPESLSGVRTREQHIRAIASIDNQYFAEPDRNLGITGIQINSPIKRALTYITPKEMSRMQVTPGVPRYYTIIGDEIQFSPVPSEPLDCEVSYYRKYLPLANDSDTNWLLRNHPMIYLYAALVSGSPYIKNNEDAQVWAVKYQSLVHGVNATEKRAQLGAQIVSRVIGSTP